RLHEYSPEELWELAVGNYSLLLRGKTGGDGNIIRGLTLDKFLDTFVAREIRQNMIVLELGCGDGGLLEKIGLKTKHAYGLELSSTNSMNQGSDVGCIHNGNLYDAPEIFKNYGFDLVILNLVLQWIPDLEKAIKAVKSLLTPTGRVLVTLPTPEFNKNDGQWLIKNGQYNWLIREPFRKEKSLV